MSRPEGSIVFDRIAGSYDETRGGMPRGRMVAAVLAELLPPTGPVLEIGVGTGLVAGGLAELGRAPLGMDLSVPMLRLARDRVPGRLAVADAHRLPVRTGSLAGAYLVHVLHLVGDIPATLAEVARVLRRGGSMVATAYPSGVPVGDVYHVVHQVRVALDALHRPDGVEHVVRLAAEVGLRVVGRRVVPGAPVTPRVAAERLEARSLSWMWPVDDGAWARLVPAALERLRALPDQDRVRVGPGPTILAFTRD